MRLAVALVAVFILAILPPELSQTLTIGAALALAGYIYAASKHERRPFFGPEHSVFRAGSGMGD